MPSVEMDDSPYVIRNYKPEDFDKLVLLGVEAEKLEPAGRQVLPHVVAQQMLRPDYSPEKDLFVVETAGSIVGYMDVRAELAIGRVVLDCWVHPEHRRRGLAVRLLDCANRRGRELGARVAHINIAGDNAVTGDVLSRLGFECVRRQFELRLDMTGLRERETDRVAPGCRYLRRGEEEKLTLIQNRAFAGHWGYNPNTLEEITYRLNMSHCSPEDVVLACDGDKVLGYCWTGMISRGDAVAGERKGRIYMLGVDPDYRGRGVGKKVLLAGLTSLKSRGLRFAELTVDGGNEVARALYLSLGFETQGETLWYEKVL